MSRSDRRAFGFFTAILTLAGLVPGLAARGQGVAPTPPVESTVPPAQQAQPVPKDDTVRDSVVKIYATMKGPNLIQPWQKQSPQEATGTGVVIEGKRILTNTHVVSYASQVFVEPNGSSEKLTATVEFIAPGIDLAILKMEDESFFDSRPAFAPR